MTLSAYSKHPLIIQTQTPVLHSPPCLTLPSDHLLPISFRLFAHLGFVVNGIERNIEYHRLNISVIRRVFQLIYHLGHRERPH